MRPHLRLVTADHTALEEEKHRAMHSRFPTWCGRIAGAIVVAVVVIGLVNGRV